jgi:hypothetical protein
LHHLALQADQVLICHWLGIFWDALKRQQVRQWPSSLLWMAHFHNHRNEGPHAIFAKEWPFLQRHLAQ